MEAALPASTNGYPSHSLAKPSSWFATIEVFPAACAILVCVASFWNTMNINYGLLSASEHVGLDVQVAIKLIIAGCAAAIGLWGLIQSPCVRRTLIGLPGIVMVAVAIVFLVTSVYALPEIAYVCRAAALVNAVYLVFVATALVAIGLRGVVIAALVGMTANLVSNWGVYLFMPSTGIFEEAFAHDLLIRRMGGLGHPNSIGRMAALALLISLAMLRSKQLSPHRTTIRASLVAIIVLSIIVSVAAISRTSIIAGIAAVVLLLADKLATRRGVVIAVSGLLVMIVGLFTAELVSGGELVQKYLVATLTKTGELEELTSATGRTAIWTEAVRLISEQPITGWGLNSTPVLLENFASHTHNLLLYVTLSGGIFAGILVVALLLWNLLFGLTSGEPIIRGISMYVLVSGLVEDTCFDVFASPCMILWVSVMLYPAVLASFRTLPSAFENRSAASYNGGGSAA